MSDFLFKNHVLLFRRVSLRAVLDGAQNVLDQNNSISLPSGTKPEFFTIHGELYIFQYLSHVHLDDDDPLRAPRVLSDGLFWKWKECKIEWMRPALIPAVIARWATVFEIRAVVPKAINDLCVINQRRVELISCCAMR